MKKRYNNNLPKFIEDLEVVGLACIFILSVLALTPTNL
tara:strand:- start:2196 stop:2309 length:114 start_codon:yes stop_codon:yes gene_type:complete